MIFNYQVLPENFERNFLINDLTKFGKNYIIIREGCFLELISEDKSIVYSIPFWEEKSQYWDLRKIYKFDDKCFILASNLKYNCLKLINLDVNDSLEFSFSGEIKDELVNIHSDYIMTVQDVYKISQKGMEKIFFESKFNYYDEIRNLRIANINEVVFFIINGKIFSPFNINKINNILTNSGRIKVINFDENRVDLFFLGDLIGNPSIFPIQIGKILVYEISHKIGILIFSNLGCFDINLDFSTDFPKNLSQINKINIDYEFLKLIIFSFDIHVEKLNTEEPNSDYFLFLLYSDRYNLFENTLYFLSQDFSKIIKFSEKNDFIKKEEDFIIIVNEYTEIKEVNVNNLNDIENFKSAKSLDFSRKRIKSSIIQDYSLYEKTKKESIWNFIDSFDLISFDISENEYVFRVLNDYVFFEIKIDKNYQKSVMMIDLQTNEKIIKNKENKEFIDENLIVKMDFNDYPNLLMLKEIDKKIYILLKRFNGLVFNIIDEDSFEAEILKVVDYMEDDKFIFVIEENAVLFINKNERKISLYPSQNKLKKIRKTKEDKYVILDEVIWDGMNNFTYLKASENIEIEKTESKSEMIENFVVYDYKILYFDGVDSLVLSNDKRLSTKLSYLPLERVSFFEKDNK
ncbi:MAG: hypothetical protein ACK4GR_02225, partial [bacterium]